MEEKKIYFIMKKTDPLNLYGKLRREIKFSEKKLKIYHFIILFDRAKFIMA